MIDVLLGMSTSRYSGSEVLSVKGWTDTVWSDLLRRMWSSCYAQCYKCPTLSAVQVLSLWAPDCTDCSSLLGRNELLDPAILLVPCERLGTCAHDSSQHASGTLAQHTRTKWLYWPDYIACCSAPLRVLGRRIDWESVGSAGRAGVMLWEMRRICSTLRCGYSATQWKERRSSTLLTHLTHARTHTHTHKHARYMHTHTHSHARAHTHTYTPTHRGRAYAHTRRTACLAFYLSINSLYITFFSFVNSSN